jgi:hypothetical protein
MSRTLRPGGVFLVTNRINWERSFMPGKAFADAQLRAMLEEAGLMRIEFRPWQVYYDLIWARKKGTRSPLGRRAEEIRKLLDESLLLSPSTIQPLISLPIENASPRYAPTP